MERYRVSLHIQSKCGKIRTSITPNTDTFYAVSIAEVPSQYTTSFLIPKEKRFRVFPQFRGVLQRRNSEVYLGPSQTSLMMFFCENNWKSLQNISYEIIAFNNQIPRNDTSFFGKNSHYKRHFIVFINLSRHLTSTMMGLLWKKSLSPAVWMWV